MRTHPVLKTQGTSATDLEGIRLGELALGKINLEEIVLGEINLDEISLDKIVLGESSRVRLESKIQPLGEVSLPETTATTLAAMPSTTWTTPLHGFEMLGR